MRITYLLAAALWLLPLSAHADFWSGDDTGFGRGDPGNPCACAPGEDGVDWNGDGLADSGDAQDAPKDMYAPGTAFGPTTPGSNNPNDPNWGNQEHGSSARAAKSGGRRASGEGSSDGGRGPDRTKH